MARLGMARKCLNMGLTPSQHSWPRGHRKCEFPLSPSVSMPCISGVMDGTEGGNRLIVHHLFWKRSDAQVFNAAPGVKGTINSPLLKEKNYSDHTGSFCFRKQTGHIQLCYLFCTLLSLLKCRYKHVFPRQMQMAWELPTPSTTVGVTESAEAKNVHAKNHHLTKEQTKPLRTGAGCTASCSSHHTRSQPLSPLPAGSEQLATPAKCPAVSILAECAGEQWTSTKGSVIPRKPLDWRALVL